MTNRSKIALGFAALVLLTVSCVALAVAAWADISKDTYARKIECFKEGRAYYERFRASLPAGETTNEGRYHYNAKLGTCLFAGGTSKTTHDPQLLRDDQPIQVRSLIVDVYANKVLAEKTSVWTPRQAYSSDSSARQWTDMDAVFALKEKALLAE